MKTTPNPYRFVVRFENKFYFYSDLNSALGAALSLVEYSDDSAAYLLSVGTSEIHVFSHRISDTVVSQVIYPFDLSYNYFLSQFFER